MTSLNDSNFIHPYIDLNRKKHVASVISKSLSSLKYKIPAKKIESVLDKAFNALQDFYTDVQRQALQIIEQARAENKKIIVLSGRPFV